MTSIVPYQPDDIAIPASDIQAEPLSQPDYEAIVRYMASKRMAEWLLLTRILRATGVREAEALRIQPEHVERIGPNTFLLVRRGKQRIKGERIPKFERVSLNADVAFMLDGYMNSHRVARGFHIFEHKARAYQIAFRAASIAVTGEAHHPHELRRLFAVELFKQGYTAEQVAHLLGHASTKTTMLWYFEFTKADKIEISESVRA